MFSLAQKKVVLYGNSDYNERLQMIRSSIEACGEKIYFIVDKKHERAANYGPECIRFEELPDMDPQSIVFILTFWNIHMHEEVAKELYAKGYSQILFLPGWVGENRVLLNQMRKVYNELLYGGISKQEMIPDYYEIYSPYCAKANLIRVYGKKQGVAKGGGYVCFWAPADYIYIATLQTERKYFKGAPNDYFQVVFDRHISQYESHNELFHYIFDGGAYPQAYLDVMSNGKEEKSVLQERVALYQQMRDGIQNDPESVTYAPIFVQWNAKGHFNILDGHHRASFLYHLHFKQFPVVTRQNDFDAFCCWMERTGERI